MTNTTGMVILAGIALLAGGIKITRGDYQLGGIERPLTCRDLATPEGQKVQIEQARLSIEEGKKVLAKLQAENSKYAPGTVVKLRSCDGVQTVTVPPGGIHAQKIAECQAKLVMAQQYYHGLQQGQAVKVRAAQAPAPAPQQLAMNQAPPRPVSAPIISQPEPAQKLGAGSSPMGGQCQARSGYVSVPAPTTPEQKGDREVSQTMRNIQSRGGMNGF